MANSIENLKIYKSARFLEDQVYEVVKALPASDFFGLGNDLRRASAAVSHYVSEAHKLYSYHLKLEALDLARREAEATIKCLEAAGEMRLTEGLTDGYTSVIKQSWGLTRWLKTRIQIKRDKAEITAKEELASSLS